MSRIAHTVKNAKVTFLFAMAMLVVNFFSRKIFIEVLGNEVFGLTDAVMAYIGMLNLAELGISTAIAAMLYTPLYESNRTKVTEIVSIYGYLFRWVGIIVGTAGVILSLFLPMLFASAGVEIWMVYVAFYTFLTTTLLSYVVNYKQNLLVANQKNYMVVTVQKSILIAKTIVQIVLLKWFGGGLVTWLAMELGFAILFAILLEARIKREYPWLKTTLREGRSLLKKYPEVTRSIKQIFSHKVAAFVTQESYRIVTQLTLGLSWLTFLGNYMTPVNRIKELIIGSLSSNVAGVGHLVAEGDKSKIGIVFWQMNAMFFWIGGVIAFGFYTFASPLVELWIPSSQIFSNIVVMLMAMNLYIYIVRQPVSYFVTAYALFGDAPSAWVEAALNLAISIYFGLKYGIAGIVAGSVISTFLVVMLWRPHYLFTRGFANSSGAEYWAVMLKFVAILAAVWAGCTWLYDSMLAPEQYTWGKLIINGLIITPIMALAYGVILWFTSHGMKAFVKLSFELLTKKLRFGDKNKRA